MKDKIYGKLKSFFGFDSFKGQQYEIIKSIINGEDTFVVMPTGSGKSLCYQLPAIIQEGTTIIISPLIALMKNQVDHIRTFGNANDGLAHFLNSSLNKAQVELVKKDVQNGETKMLYLAPETLTKEETVEFLKTIKIPFVAVDEAHCISEWGHDFRPEYRRIREIVKNVGDMPIIALTASATPKVQDDILKNLDMRNSKVYKSSFDRPNLYYEIRQKTTKEYTEKEIVTYIKQHANKSGIIYCLSRKQVEELAETLRINGINALEYHAGLDTKTRTKHQDKFLMEDVDIIVATIAFGMGIDKPDVRFVIHFDVPKSLESYYQETGRAGRDGLRADCLMFYKEKDLFKLRKFLIDKPVAEREVGKQLLEDMITFVETSICKRKVLLNYFGEQYQKTECEDQKMCISCKQEKDFFEGTKPLKQLLNLIIELEFSYKYKHLLSILMGEESDLMKSYGYDKELKSFGVGKDKNKNYWKSVIRFATIEGLIYKDIETYGTLKISEKGMNFLQTPYTTTIPLDNEFKVVSQEEESSMIGTTALDEVLFKLLKDTRKKIAKMRNLQPWIIFQDPSIEEMSLKYPITFQELSQISGVSMSKAKKFGDAFIRVIKNYVEENDIDRPVDLVVKTVARKSKLKIFLIKAIDHKISLEDLSESKGMTMLEILDEIENIVYGGTKLNLDYYANEILDLEDQENIFQYFQGAESDSLEEAWEELGKDVYTLEEIKLGRIKFISEMAN